MARKSAQQRYDEMKSLLDSYSRTEKEFFSWDVKFMTAMMEKIVFKKALTKNMRTKIDQIIEEGKKSLPEKTPRIIEMENAMINLGEREREVLASFINKLFKGWKLSEKQEKFADSLIEQANRAPWVPSEEDEKDIEIILSVSRTYDSMWFGSNPSAGRIVQKLRAYKEKGERIGERDLEFAKKKFAGGFKKLKFPKFNVGDKAFTGYRQPYHQEKRFCLIIEGPYVNGRRIVYDVMVDGTVEIIPVDALNKRR